MIPKIIHLCWLSGDPFPQDIKKCLESWKEHLADYEIWLWGKAPEEIIECGYRLMENGPRVIEKPFDLDSTLWTKQAFEAKKYAFAADYIRLYALYNYGGIYLDADVLVYKPFDPLLELPYFVGCDQIRAFEAAVIGAEKGCKWIKDIFDTYEGKSFIKENGSYDFLTLPCRFHHVLTDLCYKFYKIDNLFRNGILYKYKDEDKKIFVASKNYFNSRNEVEVRQSKDSFCAHNYLSSWRKKSNAKHYRLKSILPKWVLAIIFKLGRLTWSRSKYAWFQINFEK